MLSLGLQVGFRDMFALSSNKMVATATEASYSA